MRQNQADILFVVTLKSEMLLIRGIKYGKNI